jgi:cation diffusion facilitator CzcD-associated flavoprotein CzcO
MLGTTRPDTRFIIIGAGISGVLMAIKLRERGFRNFTVLEKAGAMGGTWRDNVYPGVACDVAAHLYSYSFARNPSWRSRYAKGADIWRYYHDVARRHGVLPHIHYNQEVRSAHFERSEWRLTTEGGREYRADIVIAAVGRLHHPALPHIPGTETFPGPKFHTARWDTSVTTAGKRVGLIGTGSTATQIIRALAGEGASLTVFQRTPQWVFPVADTPNPWWRRLAFRLSKSYWQRYYLQLQSETEARGRATTGSEEARAARDQVCHDRLAAISDPELRRKLTPDYEVGCKRLVFSDGFYEAVQQPGVEIVTDPIDRIEPEGVRTADGRRHNVDILVFATGFDAHAYLRPMHVIGAGGVTIEEVWDGLPLTYHSIAIPHMPNFLLINGPYSPGGSASVVGIAEAQVEYLLQLIDRMVQDDVLIAPLEEASRRWLSGVRELARNSLWGTGGCNSWYLDKTGTPTLNPITLTELKEQIARPNFDDFEILPRQRDEPTAMRA